MAEIVAIRFSDDVETIVKEQIKENNKEEGIHLVDDEGNEVHIHDKKVVLIDKDGKRVEKHHILSKKEKVNIVLSSVLGGLALIGYILLGALLGMWWNAWVIFFVPEIIASLVRAIEYKNANKFNMAFTACFVFFFVCMVIPGGLWHPMWVVFLAIPVYHSICGSINKAIGKKDEDEK